MYIDGEILMTVSLVMMTMTMILIFIVMSVTFMFLGIASYEWNEKTTSSSSLSPPVLKKRMLVPLSGKIFLYDENIDDVASRYYMLYDGELGTMMCMVMIMIMMIMMIIMNYEDV